MVSISKVLKPVSIISGTSTHLVRVAFELGGVSLHPHELASLAGRRRAGGGRRAGCGHAAVSMDTNIPLKTMLIYFTGIRQVDAVSALPGGETLLDAVREERLDDDRMAAALRKHFQELHNRARRVADNK